MPDKQNRTRRQFTREFKRNVVELVLTNGRPIAEIPRGWGSTTQGSATGSSRTASTVASARA
jgi:transposase-like protein